MRPKICVQNIVLNYEVGDTKTKITQPLQLQHFEFGFDLMSKKGYKYLKTYEYKSLSSFISMFH